jgi:hypothetical protein
MLTAAGFAAAVFTLANAAPAFAEYGAFARDDATGKYGFSWNEANAKQAEDAAIKNCNTTGCKVVFRVSPKQCGAIALTDDGKIWGGSTPEAGQGALVAEVRPSLSGLEKSSNAATGQLLKKIALPHDTHSPRAFILTSVVG